MARRRARIYQQVGGFASGLTVVERPVASGFLSWTQVTADAAAHTKGAWTEVIASSSAAATMVRVKVKNTFVSGSDTSQLLDIGIGAGGSESVLIGNIGTGFSPDEATTTWQHSGHDWWFPVSVPAGSRISARVQSAVALGDTCDVHIELYSGGSSGSAIDTIGASTAASKGVDVAAGLSGVEGSWVEITSATTATYAAILFSVQGAADIGTIAGAYLLDLATGAAGSETAVYSDHPIVISASEAIGYDPVMPIPVRVTAGTRLAARIQSASASAQSLDVILYGVR